MTHAIRIYENGGPEVLRLEELDPGKPAAGEVQIRHTAIGVNYIDVYDRSGLYPVSLPSGLGREAAGVVTALGRRVRGLRLGERVAYVFPTPGTSSSRPEMRTYLQPCFFASSALASLPTTPMTVAPSALAH